VKGFVSVLLCVFAILGSAVACLAVDEIEARSAITEAEQRVSVCYHSVTEAQNAGANVSELLSVLNDAGMSLSRARLGLQNRDFSAAYNLAVECKNRLNGFEDQTDLLRGSAVQQRSSDFLVNVVGSGIGAIFTVVVGLWLWFFLKKRHSSAEVTAQ
jgi:tetrahydromethanopterin S-methyltransferase subunit G